MNTQCFPRDFLFLSPQSETYMTVLYRECECCQSAQSINGCLACCDANTLPAELRLTIPTGWTDTADCDQCNEVAGEWFLELESFVGDDGCQAECAVWSYEEEDWCVSECEIPAGNPLNWKLIIRAELNCVLDFFSQEKDYCELKVFIGWGHQIEGCADDLCCVLSAGQDYRVQLSTTDCNFDALTLNLQGVLDFGTPCATPPASVEVTAI